MLTRRGLLLLLLAAPVLAAATWLPALETAAWLYLAGCLGLFWMDLRLAGGSEGFEVHRSHDNRLSLGADNPVRLEVRCLGRHALHFSLRDEVPQAFETAAVVLDGEAVPGEPWMGGYTLRPLQRGDYSFGNIHLRWRGPLDLVVRQGRIPAAASVKVYPNLLDIRRYDLLLKQNRLQEMGLRQTRLFGEGTEYERLREYQPDDDYRRINWKATARRRRPVTVAYQTERSQNIVLMLDTGRMMQSPVARIAKLDYVINAALLLAYVASGKGDRVGLMTFADRVEGFVSPRQGRGQFYRLLELLYRVKAQPVEPDYARAFSYLALKHRRRALVVIFTDISGRTGVSALVEQAVNLGRQSLPLVVAISDPGVHAAAGATPGDSLSAYRRAVATELLEERRLQLDRLARSGVPALDVPADRLSLSVIQSYLEIKGKQRL